MDKKTTPFRIRNSLVKIFSQYLESPSLRVGLKHVFDELRNLNLVKSFLTLIKFTFDSLSRKIKNPCLVINKNSFLRRIFMKNIKQFFTYLVVGALVIALSISCKSNEEPEKDNTHSNHPPSGTYSDTLTIGSSSITTTATVTTSGDTCNIKGTAYNQTNATDTEQYDITITKWLHYDSSGGDCASVISGSKASGELNITTPQGTSQFIV